MSLNPQHSPSPVLAIQQIFILQTAFIQLILTTQFSSRSATTGRWHLEKPTPLFLRQLVGSVVGQRLESFQLGYQPWYPSRNNSSRNDDD